MLLLTAATVSAQTNYIHYTPADGLVQTQCETVFQDSKGYIWVGTKSGLSRFNGHEFENFDKEEKLTGQRIQNIFEYPQGTLLSCQLSNVG